MDFGKRLVLIGAAGVVFLVSAPVLAQTQAAPGWKVEPTSRCEWIGGGIDPILSCTSSVETDEAVTVFHCGSSSVESKCQTFRKEKEKPIEPSVTHIPLRDGSTVRVMRGGSATR